MFGDINIIRFILLVLMFVVSIMFLIVRPLIVDGVGRSARALFAILNSGCLFRVGLFIILCDVRAPLIRW
jgi:ascorbate-specific PTS system EIIC-type component UlaA